MTAKNIHPPAALIARPPQSRSSKSMPELVKLLIALASVAESVALPRLMLSFTSSLSDSLKAALDERSQGTTVPA